MTLERYILKQLLSAFVVALGGIALLVLPTVAIQALSRLGGVGLAVLLRYLPLVLVELVPYLLPIGFLLAVVATFGRFGADNEWTAVRMAGVHPLRLLPPGLLVAAVLTLSTGWLLSTVTPEWKYQQRDFLRRTKEDAFRSLGQGRTQLEIGDFYLAAARVDQENAFHEVILHVPREGGGSATLVADTVQLRFEGDALVVRLVGAQVLSESGKLYNESPEVRLSMAELFPYQPKNRYEARYLTSSEMRAELAAGALAPELERGFVYEIHRRHALAAIYVLFLLLGVPTGLFLRSGTQLAAFSCAVGYAFLYYLLALRLGKELAHFGAVPPIAAAWATDGLFLGVGLVSLHRTLWR